MEIAMRIYDRNEPLIVIHVPKAAGNSSLKFFEKWYGDGFLRHYFNEPKGQMPKKYDLFDLNTADNPVALHGHFNKLRNFGVEDYYPDVKQFVTILRDPFELTISNYFFTRKNSSSWKDKSRIPNEDAIEKYLINAKPNMLNHFPREITKDNYKDVIDEYFIEIGITERLEESMKWIAHKLGMTYDEAILGHHNATERDQEVPDYLRALFVERNQLEFDVYNYALEKFTQRTRIDRA
jgi:hypothetical protein